MPSNNYKNILILLLYLVTVVITATTSLECPDHCICTEETHLTNTDDIFNKAKCTSLSGLKGAVGKKSSLNSIDLSDLDLERISTNFENFKNLTELNLSYNQLTEINKLNKRITFLNLSHNKLVSGKISKIPLNVNHLDLSHNNITYLPRDLMRLSRLRKLELAGNLIDCNCQTIQVRNWLVRNNVWSDSSVTCSTPVQYRDRSWLQVKESDICNKPKTKFNADIWNGSDDEEMMLGDSPIIENGSGSGDGEANSDDIHSNILKDDLIPPSSSVHLKLDQQPEMHHNDDHDQDDEEASGFEGSGTVFPFIGDYEGSGSGDDTTIFPFPDPTQHPPLNGTISYDPPGIFEPETTTETAAPPVVEEPIERKRAKAVEVEKKEDPKEETEDVPGVVTPDQSVQGSILKTPDETKKDDQTDMGVYILLIVIGVIFVALLIIVAMKRRQQPSKRTYDPEIANRGTELKTMDRNNLGKPAEFIPLMGEKPVEKPINALDAPKLNSFKPKSDEDVIREPLLKSDDSGKETSVPNGKSPYQEENPNNNNNDNLPNGNDVNKPNDEAKPPVPAARTHVPIAPVHQAIPNDMDKHPNGIHTPVDATDDVFLPAEPLTTETPNKTPSDAPPAADENDAKPKSPLFSPPRYSPVYSPDTGRVKIKLTNLPKPKTPLLVNRGRSNAGDIILTTSPEPTRKE